MDGIVLIGVAASIVLLIAAAKPASVDGMEDTPVSIENIRKGVKNGLYKCTLTVVDGIPAVYLSGKTADGKPYSDIYPIDAADWQTLRAEGYQVVKYEEL